MASVLPPPARSRLTRELSLIRIDPPPGCAAYTPDDSDISSLRVQITGPPNTPYQSAVFLLSIRITARYPFEPPRVRFLTPVYHPNVDAAGRICLDTLKSPPAGSWSPAVSLPSLLLSLRALLASPNPDDGLVPEISEQYKRDPEKWKAEAKRRAEKEATEERLVELERRLDGGVDTKEEKSSGESGARAPTDRASTTTETTGQESAEEEEKDKSEHKAHTIDDKGAEAHTTTKRCRDEDNGNDRASAKRQGVGGTDSAEQ